MCNYLFVDRLTEIGFEGRQLQELLKIVIDEATMEELQNFIILEGEEMTDLLLVHKFTEHMQNTQSYQNTEQFIEAYSNSSDMSDKHHVVRKVLALNANEIQINAICGWLDAGNLSKKHSKIVKYRNMYTVAEIVTLISAL